MTKTIDAIYAGGVLKPLQPLDGFAENDRVTLIVETSTSGSAAHPLAGWVGGLSSEDAAAMIRTVESEFEKVDPDDWL